MKKAIHLFLMFALVLTLAAPPAQAQDEGPPALRTVALMSLGGGAGGAVLGVMVWLLDPLNPSADFTHSTLTGFAVGTIAGAVFGGMMLQSQAVLPYQAPAAPKPSEFDGAIPMGQASPAMPQYQRAQIERGPLLPIAAYQIRF
ncbi:MAG: hypothetical protein RRB13_09040 [bacterium]|nr:hypothetical protein [bacterium]